MDSIITFVDTANQLFTTIFVFGVGITILTVLVLYVSDMLQKQDAIRQNYPLIGRFRSVFEYFGEYFRQYFFAMDREEMPFNRQQRNWVDRAAKDKDNTVAFGSTRDLRPQGTILLTNCAFPSQRKSAEEPSAIVFGPTAKVPYQTNSLLNISGMSFGAISVPAVKALSKGAHLAGCWMNTGEGGLSPYHLDGGCDLVFQIGSAKFGVADELGNLSDEKLRKIAAHEQIRMFEIKLSQGAKPGEGGLLPAVKVTPEIAAARGIPQGKDCVSPNRDPDIASVGDLLDRIEHVRRITGKPTGFKAVIGETGWLMQLIEEIQQRGVESAPDFITIDGADGGTGAAPMGLIDYMGLPISESLPLVVDMIANGGLQNRVRVGASGKLITPPDVVWALCVGADYVVSARGFMFALGCIQALKCNKDTCPTGITTHDPRLQKGLDPASKSLRVANYVKNVRTGIRRLSHSCGVKEPRLLHRDHCRIVMANGKSTPLSELYPEG